MLPVEAQITAFAPSSIALRDGDDHAAVLEGAGGVAALELEVQLLDAQGRADVRERTSGVLPSPRSMSGVASVIGRNSAYRSMTPGRVLLLFGKVDGTSAYVPYLFFQSAHLTLLDIR